MTLSPAQCRAARALLNERGATSPRPQTLAQITAAFEYVGIEFLNTEGAGVRLGERGGRTVGLK
jgi:hypothetical protein